MAPNKRKHITLTLREKLNILEALDAGSSIRHVACKFNVAKSTIFDIKSKRTKLRNFVSNSYNGIGKHLHT